MVMKLQIFYFLKKILKYMHIIITSFGMPLGKKKYTFSSACDNFQQCIWLEIADKSWLCMFVCLWKMEPNIFTCIWHLLKKDKSWSWSRRTNFRLTTAKWEFSWKRVLFRGQRSWNGSSWCYGLSWKAARLISVLKTVVADHPQALPRDTCSVCMFKMATQFIRFADCSECNSLAVSKG